MLKAETKKKIATYLKIKETVLDAAIKDEKEVDLELPEELTVLTKEELEQRDTAQKNDGIKAGKEIGIKEVRKAAGIEEGGSKDPAKVAEAITAKAVKEAKVAPDEKVNQLTEQVTLLKTQLTEKDTAIAQATQTAATASLDRKIMAAFPKDRDNKMDDDDYLTLIKKNHTFKEVDGAIVVEKDGKPLRDTKTTNPLALGEAVKTIFTERTWIGAQQQQPGGRPPGGGPPAAGFTKLSEVKKHFTDQGKSMLGEEFKAIVDKAVSDNKEFDMNA